METLLNRYRNITVLLLAIFAQLILLAYQVKNVDDVPMIRIWAVSAVTPLAKVLEVIRSSTVGFLQGYITLHDAHQENQQLKVELGRLKMQNQFLQNQLSTADRAKALVAFQAQTQSKTLAARIIGLGAGVNSKVAIVDRGSVAGVEKGMAVVTPDGIVGKVLAAYPMASQVLEITDPNFAAGVISQKHHVRGTLKGPDCKVEYVQNEETVDVGEWFFTSGDDRIFPKGFPVGVTRVVRPGQGMKDIYIDPSGLQHGLDEVLILLEGVHQAIPDAPVAINEPIYISPPPPASGPGAAGLQDELNKNSMETDADRLRDRYKQIGAAQGHTFGEGPPGSKPPDFNIKLPAAGAAPVPPAAKPDAPNPYAPRPAAQAAGQASPGATPRPDLPRPPAQPPAANGAPPKVQQTDTARPVAQPPASNGAPAKPATPTTLSPRPDAGAAQKKAAPPEPAAPPSKRPSKPIDPFL